MRKKRELNAPWEVICRIYGWIWAVSISLSALACVCAFLYYLFTGKLF